MTKRNSTYVPKRKISYNPEVEQDIVSQAQKKLDEINRATQLRDH